MMRYRNTITTILLLLVAGYSMYRYFTTDQTMYLFPAITCAVVLLVIIKRKS